MILSLPMKSSQKTLKDIKVQVHDIQSGECFWVKNHCWTKIGQLKGKIEQITGLS